MKTLIVVSGGDAPGINALIASYASLATADGNQVVGADGSFPAVLRGEIEPIPMKRILPFVGQAGTLLATSRDPVLARDDAEATMKKVLSEHEIDNILLFGGNGSLAHIPPLLQQWGIPCIGIPTTIDNDVPGTERTLGFDSACNYAYASVDGALATGRALPGRIFLIETLGGDTGFLALEIAQGAAAHVVLVPEFEYDDDWLAERIMHAIDSHQHALVVYTEYIPTVATLTNTITEKTGIRTRLTRLGHSQRGAIPSHLDRKLAADMARLAYQGFEEGIQMGMVFQQNHKLFVYKGTPADFPTPVPDRKIYNRINGLD